MGALQRFRSLFTKASPADTASPVMSNSWWRILEPFTGAWQRNVEVNQDTAAAYWAVFSCVTLIAGDIAKLQPRVMQRQTDGTWKPTINRPVLRKPNSFQTRAEFFAFWVASKLLAGNTYVLKERLGDFLPDGGRAISALYVLDPRAVTPLVTPSGDVYYRIGPDNLSGIRPENGDLVVPASELIHDKMYPLYHPLVGVTPIFACGVAAMQGAAILDTSAKFFQNMQRPSGVLVAPNAISEETARTLKTQWEANFGAGKIGKTAVLGDGLKYEPLVVNAVDSQLIEQLKMSGEMIAACFHVPGYKIQVGQMPTVNNTAALNQQYYDQCLHFIIETMEERLDEGLELTDVNFETWFDLTGLLRMDPDTRQKGHSESVRGGWKAPNEARLEENLPPLAGGDTAYLQQQNYSLAALGARDEEAVNSGTGDVQSTAMNGTQVASLQSILTAVGKGEIPKESAKAAIKAAFPELEDNEVNAMVDPLKEGGTSASTAPVPAPAADPNAASEEQMREFTELVTRGLEVHA